MNPPISPTRHALTITEDDDLDLDALLIDDSLSTSQEASALAPVSSWSPRPTVPITIEEDIESSAREWILPPPSLPGDFLTSSIHRVPSKSILKKVSSYGNFDANESISSSKRGNAIKPKSSYLSFDVSVNSGVASASVASQGGSDYGLDLDLDSSSQSQIRTPFLGGARISPSSSPAAADTRETKLKSLDVSSTSNADVAAGTLDTSLGSSKLSTSGKMRRNVSFSAVNVREYDRTVGDNVSLQCFF
jgi:hypothetical protein